MASTSTVTLEDLEGTSTDIQTSTDDHLHYPTFAEDPVPVKDNEPRPLRRDRLYIGNLHPSIDEYSLLQIFSKFGKVTKLDFLFHKTGVLKGKPRGYAFVEYGDQDDALKALTMAHDKPLRGRKLTVTFAHQAPLDQYGHIGVGSGASSSKTRKTMMEVGRPTTLSMLKTGLTGRHGHEGNTRDKIALMEAKLRQMESTNPKPATPTPAPTPDDSENLEVDLGTGTGTSTLPHHPSLPMKPHPPLPSHLQAVLANNRNPTHGSSTMPNRPKSHGSSLPSLPIQPQSNIHAVGMVSKTSSVPSVMNKSTSGSGTTSSATQQRVTKPKLLGIKIKSKEKERKAKDPE